MPLTDFRCVTRFRVPYCDVDMMQHVNHASYIVWAETARCIYFAEVLKEPINGANGVILARLQFEYAQPLDYREEVAVGCRISRLGRKSLDFTYEIWSETRQLRGRWLALRCKSSRPCAPRALCVPKQSRRADEFRICGGS